MKKKTLLVLLITTMLTLGLSWAVSAQQTINDPDSPQGPTGPYMIFMPLTTKAGPLPTQSRGIIADHTVISRFESIPLSSLKSAAAIKTLFMHQSTGGLISGLGLDCLSGANWDPGYYPQECTVYAQIPNNPYDRSNWDWPGWDTPMANAIEKTDEWVRVANSQQQKYQVLGMKFCYVDGYNLDFEYYKQKMEALERAYPTKKFIWATSVLWSQSSQNLATAETIQLFNQQLRAYAIANNKILYDLADIESHLPNGNLCQALGYDALCDPYADGMGGGGGGHPDVDGSVRLAKGFWWLMARVSGWNGN